MSEEVTVAKEIEFDLFAESTANGTHERTVWSVLWLQRREISDFWEMWLSILLWMAVSYIAVYLLASLLAAQRLRRHPLGILIVSAMLVTAFAVPVTVGALTSASIAFTFSAAQKTIGSWHCLLLGLLQTFFAVLISYTRLLATL